MHNSLPWQRSSAVDGAQFGLILPNTRKDAMMARERVMKFARSAGFDEDFLGDLSIAVGEALANAAEHGFRCAGTIDISAGVTPEGIEIAISDDGPGFSARAHHERPSYESPRGFGLFLIQSVTDEIEFRNGGRTVCFLKRLPMACAS